MARPTKMTPMVRKKMEEATALDATVEEVCFYAGISKDTYYKWIKKDKKLSDDLTALRNNIQSEKGKMNLAQAQK